MLRTKYGLTTVERRITFAGVRPTQKKLATEHLGPDQYKKRLKTASRRRWNDLAKWWSRHVGYDGDYARRHILMPNLKPLFKQVRGRTVLDAGCGEGFFSRKLTHAGAEVTAVDFSSRQLEMARRRSKSDYSCIEDDVERLTNLDDRQFDFCFCINLLMDIVAPRLALQAIERHLKVGGHLIVVIPDPSTFGPRGIGLALWNAKKLREVNGETVYSILIEESAPLRTFYFHRPDNWYRQLVPRNLHLITSREIWNEFPKKPGIWRVFGNRPVFRMYHWQKSLRI